MNCNTWSVSRCNESTIAVAYFQRKWVSGAYSLERLFADVRDALPEDVQPFVQVAPCQSRGLWRRVWNLVAAALHQRDVNHVTGDVHYLTLLLDRCRTVLTIHDCGVLESSRGLRHWLLRLFWFWLPVRRAAIVTVVSEASKRALLRYVRCDPARVQVIHDCVSPQFVPRLKPFDATVPRILQIGTTPNKNIERLAAALAGIPCRLVVVGRLADAQRAALETHALCFENLIGLSDEALLEQYRRCDLVSFVSTLEGFGLPIVEANAVGRPVVTSNLSSMPEVAGDAACLVDPYDVASIRAGILRVVGDSDYRECLVAAGFRNVERFRPAAIAAQYAAVYRILAAQV